ncbi:alpha/beta hydrolase [Actinokineospora bangkokensis]|uniref:Alpha/beta hydrolase n=1 Tax=Actinokineospora bangkokensis TaxID=1193682 RepID=A0A1Q9LL56_9PSEU|nr:alpha/beta hydrolase [Actinokineospora bangkokensis]
MTVNGVDFTLLEAGGPGPLALCLHGFPDTAHTWRHLLPALAEQGFHAVAPFLRGYAPTTPAPDGAYEVGALAADANGLHQALGAGSNAVLVGHDWGAAAAYAAASAAPERWRRLVTMAVPPPGPRRPRSYEQHKRSFYMYLFTLPVAERVVAAEGYAFLDDLWADWSPGYDAAEDLALVKRALADPAHLTAALGYYRAQFDTSTHQPRYAREQAHAGRAPDTPTLYLHGADDGCILPPEPLAAQALLSPGSRADVLAGVGHFLHLESPAEVNRRVLDWIA